MKKLHKLLMTSTAIVCIFSWNIHSTPVAAKPNYIGRWYRGISTENISFYRVFHKDGKGQDYYENVKTDGKGLLNWWNYQVLSNGSIRVFSLLKETCVLTKINEMQCYSGLNGKYNSLGKFGFYIKR